MTTLSDANLLEMYTQAQNFPENKKNKKTGKIIKTMRNQHLIDNLTVRRNKPLANFADQNITYEEKKKKSGERKTKLETLPGDLSSAITMGQSMITKFNKRSRMK